MKKVSGLNSLYQLGHVMGQFKNMLNQPGTTYADIAPGSAMIWAHLRSMTDTETPVPFQSTGRVIKEFVEALDVLKDKLSPASVMTPITGTIDRYRLNDLATRLEAVMAQELDAMPIWFVEGKGNLSIDRLIAGSSSGYASKTLLMLDDFMKREIDSSGRCLAFNCPTACGFHILRAVEIGLKAYVLAATGQLPKVNQRNWGQYIAEMEKASASSDLIDLLRILKTKRNPLMHPQDDLDTDDAIGIFCICQNAIETMITDVREKGLEVKFSESLKALPTL